MKKLFNTVHIVQLMSPKKNSKPRHSSIKGQVLPGWDETSEITFTKLIEYLDEAIDSKPVQGIYRQQGVNWEQKELLKEYLKNQIHDLSNYSPHSVASVVKKILRELYEPVMTYKTYNALIQATIDPDKLKLAIATSISTLPQINRRILKCILNHLNRVVGNKKTKMTIEALGGTIGVNLLRRSEASDDRDFKSITLRKAVAIAILSGASTWDYEKVIEIDPDANKRIGSLGKQKSFRGSSFFLSTSNILRASPKKEGKIGLETFLPPISSTDVQQLFLIIDHLNKNCMKQEGLYRRLGDTEEQKCLLKMYEERNISELKKYSPHSVIAVLKQILKDKYEPLMTYRSYGLLASAANEKSKEALKESLSRIIAGLPTPNRQILQEILLHFSGVLNESGNRLRVESLASSVGIHLIRQCESEGGDTDAKSEALKRKIASALIENAKTWQYGVNERMVVSNKTSWSKVKKRASVLLNLGTSQLKMEINDNTALHHPTIPSTTAGILVRMIQHLNEHGIDTAGLFKKQGKISEQKELLQLVMDGELPELADYSTASISAVVKNALRDCYAPLLTYEAFDTLNAGSDQPDILSKTISSVMVTLPRTNLDILRDLLQLLLKISKSVESDMNLDTLTSSVGVFLARRSESVSDQNYDLMASRKIIAKMLIENADSWPYEGIDMEKNTNQMKTESDHNSSEFILGDRKKGFFSHKEDEELDEGDKDEVKSKISDPRPNASTPTEFGIATAMKLGEPVVQKFEAKEEKEKESKSPANKTSLHGLVAALKLRKQLKEKVQRNRERKSKLLATQIEEEEMDANPLSEEGLQKLSVMIKYLETNCLTERGLFRRQGKAMEQMNLMTKFDEIDLSSVSPHSIASVIIQHLRDVYNPIFSHDQYKSILSATTEGELKLEKVLQKSISELPPLNQQLLSKLLSMLNRVTSSGKNEDVGELLAASIGVLLIRPMNTSHQTYDDMRKQKEAAKHLIRQSDIWKYDFIQDEEERNESQEKINEGDDQKGLSLDEERLLESTTSFASRHSIGKLLTLINATPVETPSPISIETSKPWVFIAMNGHLIYLQSIRLLPHDLYTCISKDFLTWDRQISEIISVYQQKAVCNLSSYDIRAVATCLLYIMESELERPLIDSFNWEGVEYMNKAGLNNRLDEALDNASLSTHNIIKSLFGHFTEYASHSSSEIVASDLPSIIGKYILRRKNIIPIDKELDNLEREIFGDILERFAYTVKAESPLQIIPIKTSNNKIRRRPSAYTLADGSVTTESINVEKLKPIPVSLASETSVAPPPIKINQLELSRNEQKIALMAVKDKEENAKENTSDVEELVEEEEVQPVNDFDGIEEDDQKTERYSTVFFEENSTRKGEMEVELQSTDDDDQREEEKQNEERYSDSSGLDQEALDILDEEDDHQVLNHHKRLSACYTFQPETLSQILILTCLYDNITSEKNSNNYYELSNTLSNMVKSLMAQPISMPLLYSNEAWKSLHSIFHRYAKQSLSMNLSELIQLCQDCYILDEKVSLTNIERSFNTVLRMKYMRYTEAQNYQEIDFCQFFYLLTTITKVKYPQYNPSIGLQHLLILHVFPYAQRKMYSEEMSTTLDNYGLITPSIFQYVLSHIPTIASLFNHFADPSNEKLAIPMDNQNDVVKKLCEKVDLTRHIRFSKMIQCIQTLGLEEVLGDKNFMLEKLNEMTSERKNTVNSSILDKYVSNWKKKIPSDSLLFSEFVDWICRITVSTLENPPLSQYYPSTLHKINILLDVWGFGNPTLIQELVQ